MTSHQAMLEYNKVQGKTELSSTQMEENHTFQFTPAMDGNESPIPTIASLPDTPSKVPDS